MFKRTDVVCLKSGGTKMIVTEASDTHVKCSWNDAKGVMHEKLIASDLLQLAHGGSGMLIRKRR